MLGLDNPVHLIFLLVLLLLVFGAKRLPEMGRSLGSGMRGFKESLSGEPGQPAAVEQPGPTLSAAPAPVAVAAPAAPAAVPAVAQAPAAVASEPSPVPATAGEQGPPRS
jgi:sec-independent protein translocase protein TatA